jgi:galactose oxidase
VIATAAAYTPDAPLLEREGWTATASAQSVGHDPDAVLDGDAFSYWSSQTPPSPAVPQSITIDMRGPQEVSGVVYEPRQGAQPSGVVGQFAVSVSDDGIHFVTVSTGTWADTDAVKKVGIEPVSTRFVRLSALSNAGAPGPVAAAEVYFEGVPRAGVASSSAGTAQTVSTNPAVVGEWGPTIGFPLVPVAVALLPHNEMLLWSADEDLNYTWDNEYTQTAILNLTTGVVSPDTVTNTDHNMFCPGVAVLANGDIMVTGGIGDDKTSIYDPATNAWSAGPPMNIGRGYQAMTLLSNGQAFTLGGSWSGALGGKLAEVWSPTGGWRELTGVPATPMYTADPQGVYRADNHGWFIATSGGKVLQAGPSKQMNWITTSGAGTITAAGLRGSSADAMNGNAVYYDTNKIITMGGAPAYQDSNATAQAYAITIKKGKAKVKKVASMHYPRAFANSVVLPNGQVLTVGGQTYAVPFSDDDSILNPEMWNPGSGKFTVMAPEAEPRNYHSVALLLPDGRVFSGGGGLCGSCDTNHPDGQIYTPPYLLNPDGTLRSRPTISSAPTSAATGQTITVTTGGAVAHFSMVRFGEATHSVDNDQRRIPLKIVSHKGSTYRLAVPSDPGIALPGPYMLFALDSHGTPSVSTTVSITNAATAPADGYGQAVVSAGPALYWPLNDAQGPTIGDASGNGDTGNVTGSGITYGVPSPVETASGTGVSLNGSSSQIVASEPVTAPTSYSEEMWFKTTTTSGGYLMGFGDAPSGLSSGRDRQIYMSNDGQLNFGIYDGQAVTIRSPKDYNDGQWHQVVATEGSDGMHLYVDGQSVAGNSTNDAQAYPGVGYWRVGGDDLANWPNSPSSNFLAGTISDAAVYMSELSSTQIVAQYQASPAN